MRSPTSPCKRAALLSVMAASAAMLIAVSPSHLFAAGLPDLSISRSGPAQVGIGVPFTETLTITNSGTAAAGGARVSYAPGAPSVTGTATGTTCAPILKGHSGRGGGYTRVGWTCSETVSGGLAPGKSMTMSLRVSPATIGTLTESFGAAPLPASAQLNLVSHGTGASVLVFRPPAPAAPTAVSAQQVQDQLNVTWTPAAATASYVTSSTITATPTGGSSAPVLTSTVSGSATSGTISQVQPLTTYSITVLNRTSGGNGPASTPIQVTTGASSMPPSAPSAPTARWNTAGATTGTFVASWIPGASGDSPIDQFEVMMTTFDSDTPQSFTVSVTGSDTVTSVTVDDSLDWSIQVRAHNAAGWSPWSPATILPALN